jgi:hypothetical protein
MQLANEVFMLRSKLGYLTKTICLLCFMQAYEFLALGLSACSRYLVINLKYKGLQPSMAAAQEKNHCKQGKVTSLYMPLGGI